MAKILIKRSAVPNKPPLLNDLDLGEIGINTADGKMYIKRRSNSVDSLVEIGNVQSYLGYTPANKAGDELTGTLTLTANTATVAPLKFKQGVVTTAPQAHAMEWDGAYLYMTNNGSQRKRIAYTDTPSTSTSIGWATARTVTLNNDASASFTLDGTANVTAALTLATVNSTVGTFGGMKTIPVVTVNAKGLVTSVTTAPVTLTTSDIPEGTNKYYYDSRARAAISATGALKYDPVTGVMSFNETERATVASTGDYNDLLNRPVVATKFATNSTSSYPMFSISIAQVRGVKISLSVYNVDGDVQMQEILVVHNGSAVFTTDYAMVISDGVLGTVDAEVVAGNLVCSFTPTTIDYKVVSVTRTHLLA